MFHKQALKCLDKAKALLLEDHEDSCLYASLQLRMAIEHWFYDLRHMYLSWLPQNELDRWQPHKLMKTILEVDPDAMGNASLLVLRGI